MITDTGIDVARTARVGYAAGLRSLITGWLIVGSGFTPRFLSEGDLQLFFLRVVSPRGRTGVTALFWSRTMNGSTVQLDPQLRDAFAKSAELAALNLPPVPGIVGTRLQAELIRKYWNEGGPTMRQVVATRIPVASRTVPVVIYRPNESPGLLPVFVYLHGGGFKIGSEWANDRQMREIAHAWGGIVVSADYLHVPENLFPAAVTETADLLRTLHECGNKWGMDGHRVAFGGNSAGASVSFGAATALGGVPWLRAAVGVVGAFSGDTSSESMQRYGAGGLFPDLASVPPIFEDYVPRSADRNDPRVNLLLADPSHFPVTFLAAAEFDVFRDASAAMANRLELAGRLHAFKIYPGMAHLFFGFSRSVQGAADCTSDVSEFLRQALPV